MASSQEIVSYDPKENGEYEVLERLSKFSFKTIFDVGCNVGEWSLTASHYFPSAAIHTFEISKETFKTLSGRLNSTFFVNNNFGLSNMEGKFVYKDYGANAGVNTLLLNLVFHDKRRKPDRKLAITTTGDIYCAEKEIANIDFVKIDVEGAEYMVLEGLSGMLYEKEIRVIQFEYGYANGDSKSLMRDFFEFFQKYGYVVGRVRKGGIVFAEWNYQFNDFTSGPNFIAVKKDDTQIISELTRQS